jgi:hypothetical protein
MAEIARKDGCLMEFRKAYKNTLLYQKRRLQKKARFFARTLGKDISRVLRKEKLHEDV